MSAISQSSISQVWNQLMIRRIEKQNKLMQPCVVELENLIRDDLSDLRSMVSCNYGAMVMGVDDIQKFHHMANKNGASLSGKDRRIFKMTIRMVLRIIWLALQRPNIALIEMELTRMTATDSFNNFVHQGRVTEKLKTAPYEDQILQGTANVKEPRLLQHSPLGKEIILCDHDHRMLSIGIITFPPPDERQNFLEVIYSAPEELFVPMGVTVGILGLNRSDFDEMLVKKKIKKGNKKKSTASAQNVDESAEEEIEEEEEEEEEKPFEFTFKLPKRVKHDDGTIPDAFPSIPPQYQRSEKVKKMIEKQCAMWKKVIERSHLGIPQPSISLI